MATNLATRLLLRECQNLTNNPPAGIAAGIAAGRSKRNNNHSSSSSRGKSNQETQAGKEGEEEEGEEDIYVWEACIAGPENTPFEGGIFIANLFFPENYPYSPPKMKFTVEMWHPNVYPSGEVCISILHPPGKDPTGYESELERWTPSLNIEKILLSVMSLLAEPNDESPANVEAAKMWRTDRAQFERVVRNGIRRSLGLRER